MHIIGFCGTQENLDEGDGKGVGVRESKSKTTGVRY